MHNVYSADVAEEVGRVLEQAIKDGRLDGETATLVLNQAVDTVEQKLDEHQTAERLNKDVGALAKVARVGEFTSLVLLGIVLVFWISLVTAASIDWLIDGLSR